MRPLDAVRDEALAGFARLARAIVAALVLLLLLRDTPVPPGAPRAEVAALTAIGAMLGITAWSLWRSRQHDNSMRRRSIEVSLDLLVGLLVATTLHHLALWEVTPSYLAVAAAHAGLRVGMRRGLALVVPTTAALVVMRIHGIPSWVVPSDVDALDLGLLWPPAVVLPVLVAVVGWATDQLREAEAEARAARLKAETTAEKFERANAALSRFARTIAHDLRAPLSAAAGSAELLRERGQQLPPEQVHQLTDTLARSARRASELVADMLDIAHGPDRSHRLVVSDLRAGLLTLLGPTLAQHDATLEIESDDNQYAVPPGHVRPAILNLVTNAVKHGGDNRRIRVTICAPSDDQIRIDVDDDGPGIPAADRRRLVLDGERGTTSAQGTGHGLADVHRIVTEDLHGTLQLSDSPLGGTRATILIPTTTSRTHTGGRSARHPSPHPTD
jgi:signal transduction histidine kinase